MVQSGKTDTGSSRSYQERSSSSPDDTTEFSEISEQVVSRSTKSVSFEKAFSRLQVLSASELSESDGASPSPSPSVLFCCIMSESP
eukprot:CAMPEP_0169403880 /NCGR_PEP_ID=MMETSP1017-20121227/56024_1 /TAXON_ID=342587 /ORGANISM="Karlodinium micrum, Strain CCMP2283" /LENGTH=85 /DNA_ID=CAMNT_0009510189 /DNA_START=31 /DNA_END=285 /DNA_ORIENTATION=-